MTRRTLTMSLVALAAATSVTLAACGGGTAPTSSASGNTADGKVHLVWDMWASGAEEVEWLEKTAEIAREKNPDVSIELRTSGWEDYFTKLTANMSSGNVSCLTSMNGQRVSAFHQALSPLSEEDLKIAGISEDDFAEGAFEILSHDGKLYGIPYDVAAMLMFYNKDMVAEAGIEAPKGGWSFDDFLSTAKALTNEKHKGFGIALGEYQWLAMPIAMSGLQPVNEDGKLDLTNPKFLEAAEWYANLVTKEKVADPAPSASETAWGEEQFLAGNVGMAIAGTWNARKNYTNEAGFTAGATRLPQGQAGPLGLVLGSGFGIGSSCEGAEREAALKVLGALVSKEAQDHMAHVGRSYPALKASQDHYFDSFPEDIREEVKVAFDEAFKGVVGQRSTGTWPQLTEYLTPNLVPVYTGDAQMKDVLEAGQKQFGN